MFVSQSKYDDLLYERDQLREATREQQKVIETLRKVATPDNTTMKRWDVKTRTGYAHTIEAVRYETLMPYQTVRFFDDKNQVVAEFGESPEHIILKFVLAK